MAEGHFPEVRTYTARAEALSHLGHKHRPFTSKLALATSSLGGAQAVRVQNTEAFRCQALAKDRTEPRPLPEQALFVQEARG